MMHHIPKQKKLSTNDLAGFVKIEFERVGADLNITLGMSIGVLLTCFMFNIKLKGLGGWIHELFAAPFGIWLAPFNFVLNLVEFSSKTISHGMRLFGNMYAGELVFLLIAMLGGAWAMPGEAVTWVDPVLAFFHVLAGFVWAVFHILVIVLQAFSFYRRQAAFSRTSAAVYHHFESSKPSRHTLLYELFPR